MRSFKLAVLLVVVLTVFALAVQIEQRRVAGVLIGLAVFVKPYAIVLVPWLAVSHGAAAALISLGVIGAGLLMPSLVFGWGGNLDQLQAWAQVVAGSTAPNLVGADNISLAAMWAKWLGIGPLATAIVRA